MFDLHPLEPRTLHSAVLPGDADNSRTVDLADFTAILATIGTADPATDHNRDGNVDLGDIDITLANMGKRYVAYDWFTATINGVQEVYAPNPYDFGRTYTVTDRAALYGSDGIPSLDGIHQGWTANCYALAAWGAVALHNPDYVKARVYWNDFGGVSVEFNALTTGRAKLIVNTSADLSIDQYLLQPSELWARFAEKAFAAFRTWNGTTSVNTLESTGWGNGAAAFQQFGLNVTYHPTLSATLTRAAEHPVVIHTTNTPLDPAIVASHVYIVTGSYTVNGTLYIKTFNPWGMAENFVASTFWKSSFQAGYEGVVP